MHEATSASWQMYGSDESTEVKFMRTFFGSCLYIFASPKRGQSYLHDSPSRLELTVFTRSNPSIPICWRRYNADCLPYDDVLQDDTTTGPMIFCCNAFAEGPKSLSEMGHIYCPILSSRLRLLFLLSPAELWVSTWSRFYAG